MAEARLQGLKADYNGMFDLTKEKAREVREFIEMLQRELGLAQSPILGKVDDAQVQEGDIKPKLLFLQSQHESNKHILEILNTNHAALNAVDIDRRLSEEERATQIEFYRHATGILVMVKDSLHTSLMCPPGLIERIYRGFESIVVEWRQTILAATTVTVTAGGLYGLGFFGTWNLLAWLPEATFGSFGPACCAAGAATPLVAIVVVVGFVAAVGYIFHQDEDAVCMRKALDREIEKLKRNPLPIQELIDLRNVYERAFVFPMAEPAPDDQCIVCHEALPAQAGSEQPEECGCERAPGCHGKHFLHKECLMQWTREKRSMKCTVCKQ